LEDPRADGKARIKWILKKLDRGMNWSVSGQEQVAGCCECSEPSGSIKCRKSLD
jgi:hypothetical protein